MSNFPDYLFQLTPRDQQVTPLEALIYFDPTNSVAAATVNTTGYTVPKGKILALSSSVVRATPGAAQTLLYTRMLTNDQTGSYYLKCRHEAGGAALTHFDSLGGGVTYIPEGWRVFCSATFSAGAAANTIDATYTGILIPRGNFQI